MPATLTMAPAIRFHLSINVSDLKRSIDFYRILFGCEPAKQRSDYAKFELEEPPVVFSLEPTPRTGVGALNHVGFRMPDSSHLVAMQQRLAAAGIPSQREEGVECCYARQTKFWAYDPDGTLWEVYTLEDDLDHRGAGQTAEQMRTSTASPAVVVNPTPISEGNVWEHRMNAPVPERIPVEDAKADEIRLRGSFNLSLSRAEQEHLLQEAMRALRPGGRLFVHVLTSEKPYAGTPQLSGPASAIQMVPRDRDIVEMIENAGFQKLKLLKFGEQPCFIREGVALRETQIEAWKAEKAEEAMVTVVYKGPLREILDDGGRSFQRGQHVRVETSVANWLEASLEPGSLLVIR